MPSKSDTHRRSGLYETQNSMTVGNNCAQDRERYGILWQTSKRQTTEPLHTSFIRKKTMYVFTVYLLCVCWPLSSPDGSYTEEQNSETQVKANINPAPAPTHNPTSTTPEFDDEFDDEEVLPTIGTCKALYPFEGNTNVVNSKNQTHVWVINSPEGTDHFSELKQRIPSSHHNYKLTILGPVEVHQFSHNSIFNKMTQSIQYI